VDEGRKRVILIAAAILAARKLLLRAGQASAGHYLCDCGFDSLGG